MVRGQGLTAGNVIDTLPGSAHVLCGLRCRACASTLAVHTGAPEGALLARRVIGRPLGACCVRAECWRGTRARGGDAQRAELTRLGHHSAAFGTFVSSNFSD